MVRRPEAARPLLLDLHHADIPLRLIIVKLNLKAAHKNQHNLLVIAESILRVPYIDVLELDNQLKDRQVHI